jgi:hypothetical protein
MQLTTWEKVAFALSLLVVVSGVLSMAVELAPGYTAPGGVMALAMVAIVWVVNPVDRPDDPRAGGDSRDI